MLISFVLVRVLSLQLRLRGWCMAGEQPLPSLHCAAANFTLFPCENALWFWLDWNDKHGLASVCTQTEHKIWVVPVLYPRTSRTQHPLPVFTDVVLIWFYFKVTKKGPLWLDCACHFLPCRWLKREVAAVCVSEFTSLTQIRGKVMRLCKYFQIGNSCDSDGRYNVSESCKTHRRKKQKKKDTKKGRNKDRMKEVGWAHVDLFWKQLPLRENCFSRLHHRHWKPSLARLLPAAHRGKQTGKNNLIEGQNLIKLKNSFYGQNSLERWAKE